MASITLKSRDGKDAGSHDLDDAVFGVQPQQNLFIGEQGQWRGSFIPAALRFFPFCLGRVDAERFAALQRIEADQRLWERVIREAKIPKQ